MPVPSMPDDDARKKAGERFAADLRAMREGSGLSAQDLREKMRVPDGLFEAFESGGLVGHPMFNRVYLRSLTRSYAAATETPSAPVLAALDATLNGEYEEGQLQREVEAHEAPGREAEKEEAAEIAEEEAEATEEAEASEEGDERARTSEAAAGAAAAAAEAAGTAARAESGDEPDWATSSPPGASTEEAEQREREKEERAQEREREREERARRQEERRQERVAEQESAAAAREDRAAKEQPAQREERSARRRGRHRRGRQRSSGSNAARWIIGGLVLAAIAVGLFFLVPSLGGGGTDTAQTTATATDTAGGGQQERGQQSRRPVANLQLGDPMNFTVVASGGPVKDLKVTRDQDVRRPYWIEKGQATVFPAHQRIIIENPPSGESTLQNVHLLAEGYSYPTDRRDDQGRIVITRQNMQSFADTLRGEPAQIPAQRDTAALFGP